MKPSSIPATVERLSRISPHLREDIRAEADLAILEADREGHDDEWVVQRLERFVSATRRVSASRRESIGLEEVAKYILGDDKIEPLAVAVPSFLTPREKRRFRRNLIIQVANKAGLSQRLIAQGLGLPFSCVNAICHDDLSKRIAPRPPLKRPRRVPKRRER